MSRPLASAPPTSSPRDGGLGPPAVSRSAAGGLTIAAFVGLALLAAIHVVHHLQDPHDPTRPSFAMYDFRGAIYYPLEALVDGRNPYEPRDDPRAFPPREGAPLYLPITLATHLPLALLSLRAAELLYFSLNVLLVPILAYCVLRLCGLATSTATVFGTATIMMLARPCEMALFAGQSTIYVSIGVYIALLFARRRPVLGGLGLFLACLKPTFGVPLGFFMLWRREGRAFLVGATLVALGCLLTGVVLARTAGGVRPLLASLAARGVASEDKPDINAATSIYRVDAVALLARPLGRPLGLAGDLAATGALLALAAWAMRRLTAVQGDGPRAGASELFAGWVTCLAVVICVYHQTYDALLAAPPLVAAATGCWRAPNGDPVSWARWLVLGLLTVPTVNYLPTLSAIETLGLKGGALLAAISLNGAALTAAFLLHVVVGARPGREPTATRRSG